MYIKEIFPRTLNEFLGNNKIRKQFYIYKNNFLRYKRIPSHILLYGNPGLGKTTIAKILASEMQTDFHPIIGENVDKENLSDLVLGIQEGDVLFVDEIHSLSKEIGNIFLPLLEEKKFLYYHPILEISIDKIIPDFMCIGATTDIGSMSKPLLNRFQILTMDKYTVNELIKILNLYIKDYNDNMGNVKIKIKEKIKLAQISQFTPRTLKQLFFACIDIIIYQNKDTIDEITLEEMMWLKSINKDGLNLDQQKYLDFMKKVNRPIGIGAIAAYLGKPQKDIENNIEPYLLEIGSIARTQKGRIVL